MQGSAKEKLWTMAHLVDISKPNPLKSDKHTRRRLVGYGPSNGAYALQRLVLKTARKRFKALTLFDYYSALRPTG